jgi:WD40 repeat protein
VEDVAFSEGREPYVAAAVADARSGRAVVWQLRTTSGGMQFVHVGEFVSQGAPVLSVALTADGARVATGGSDGRVFVWQREDAAPLDYGAAIDGALARLSGVPAKRASERRIEFTSLSDPHDSEGVYRLLPTAEDSAHDDAVRSLAFSSDGERLVSAADDFTIKVWNPARGRLIETLRGHGGWVRAAAFAPGDDDLILSAGDDRTVKSWRVSQYAENVVLDLADASGADPGVADATGAPEVQAHDDEILSARFSRDGSKIVTTSRDQSAKVWNVRSQSGRLSFEGPIILTDGEANAAPKQLKEGHEYLALSIHASPDGKTVLLGGVDGTVRAFDIERGTQLGLLPRTGLNTSFAMSDDGRLLLTASSAVDVSAQLWELGEDGALPEGPRLELGGHEHAVTAFAISRDGTRLFTGDQRGTGNIWDAQTGKRIGAPLSHHEGLRINAAAFLPDGRLVTASGDATVAIYDPETQEVEQTFRHPGFVTDMDLSPRGDRLATISERTNADTGKTETILAAWDLASGTSQTLLNSSTDGPETRIGAVRYSRDGARMATVHGGYDAPESFVRVWSVHSDRPASVERTLRFPKRMLPADAAILPPGRTDQLVSLHGNAAFLWDLKTLEHQKSYRPHAAVVGAGFTADGSYVATCSASVKIWNTSDGRPVYRLETPHEGMTRSVEFSPVEGGRLFVTAGSDGAARVWRWNAEASTVEPVQTLADADAAEHPLHQATFSPDGQRILTVGEKGRAQIWTLGDALPAATLRDVDAVATDFLCGAFSPDGMSVVVGGDDKQARLWSVTGEALADEANPPHARLQGHADRIESVVFLPAEPGAEGLAAPRVLTASRDRSARVWDALTGREVISLRRHSLGLTAVDAVRLGAEEPATVMTAGLDGRVILWPAGE